VDGRTAALSDAELVRQAGLADLDELKAAVRPVAGSARARRRAAALRIG
jgi:hypothetical protein